MQDSSATACLIIVGNEILSGRTQDTNLAWLAKALNEAGIRMGEARVIPDREAVIVETVNTCRRQFTYVFTTGGIGPTHDDITTACIAKAFGVPVERNKEAEAILEKHYGREQLNDARLKMADIPKGATLIYNPVSAAPGFRLENVFVLAGVPRIMQAMFDGLKSQLKGGRKTLSKTLSSYITEGVIADSLSKIQSNNPLTEIGSYPFIRQGKLGVSLVVRAGDEALLDAACREVKTMLVALGQTVEEEP